MLFMGIFFLSLTLGFLGPTVYSTTIVVSLLLSLNLFMAIRALNKKSYPIFVVAFFMLSYSYIPFSYYILGNPINIRTIAHTATTVYETSVLLLLFQVILWWKLNIKEDIEPIRLSDKVNVWPFIPLVIASLLFTTFGRSGVSIIESGGYKNTLNSVESSSFFAYSIITISLAFVYANTKLKRITVYGLALFFCVKNLLLGGRIEAIQLSLALFILHFRYIWSRKMIILISTLLYILIQVWGLYRGNTNESFASFGQENLYITGGEVYYASMRIIFLIEEGFLGLQQRIEALIYYFLSVVLPFSWLPDEANLSTYLKSQFSTGGGGLAPVFFYAFGGYPTVILAAYLIAKVLNKMNNSKYYYMYGVFLLATWPRWYAYYPIQPIKFCVYGLLLFWFLENTKFGASKIS